MSAEDVVKVLQQFVKPRYVAAVLVAMTFLTYTPFDFFVWLGVSDFYSKLHGWFLFAWALSLGLTLVYIGEAIYRAIQGKRARKERVQYLHQLTAHEREILSSYISGGTKTVTFRLSDGVIGGLVKQDVLHVATNLTKAYDDTDFNMSQWAWDYLNSNPHLLKESVRPRRPS